MNEKQLTEDDFDEADCRVESTKAAQTISIFTLFKSKPIAKVTLIQEGMKYFSKNCEIFK